MIEREKTTCIVLVSWQLLCKQREIISVARKVHSLVKQTQNLVMLNNKFIRKGTHLTIGIFHKV